MKVHVNLLPEEYVQIRQRYRRLRQGILLGVLLLALQVVVGVILHFQALKTHDLHQRIDELALKQNQLHQELRVPKAELDALKLKLLLTERLRSTHHWSRFLAELSETTPESILLTSIVTSPPQWSKSLHVQAVRASQKADDKESSSRPRVRILDGMTVRGFAMDYNAMSKFVRNVHESRLFRTLDLRESRQESLFGQSGVMFELICRW